MRTPLAIALAASALLFVGCTPPTPAASPTAGAPKAATSAPAQGGGDVAKVAASTAETRKDTQAALAKVAGCDFSKKAANPADSKVSDCAVAAAELTIQGGVLYAQLNAEAASGNAPALVTQTRDAVKALYENAAGASMCLTAGSMCDKAQAFASAVPKANEALAAWPK